MSLQKGSIYFFYRPKLKQTRAKTIDDVQRFIFVLKPTDVSHYISIIIGKKKLPATAHRSYFAFVGKTHKNIDSLLDELKEQFYQTKTGKKRYVSAANCLGEGKYMIFSHHQHTNLAYQLINPENIKSVQRIFKLKKKDEFILQIKDPDASSPANAGLSEEQKAKFPRKLEALFAGRKFIPLKSVDFLNYEGAELLLITSNKSSTVALEKIHLEHIASHLKSGGINFE